MTLIEELSNQLIPIAILIAVGWYISHFAKATIPRLLFISFGLYFAISGKSAFDHLIGLGFVLPHIKFFFSWIVETIDDFKKGTLDIYYSILTIYYKTRNLFIKAYRFFNGKKSNQKSTGNSYYEKQDYREYEDFGQNSKNQNRKEQRKQEKYTYEEPSQEYSEPKQKEKIEDTVENEYKQFFSNSYYEVLGVTPNDDFDTIKKKFRKLQRQYHPDLNMDKSEFYTKISQNLNKAYEYFEKNHRA